MFMKSESWIQIGYNEFLYLDSYTYEFRIYTFEFINMNSYTSTHEFIYSFHIWISMYMNSCNHFIMNSYKDCVNSFAYEFTCMNSYMNSYKLWIHMIFSYLNSYAGHMIFSYMNWYAGHSYEFIVLACISGSQSWEHPWRISRTLPKHSYAAHGLKWSDFGKTKASGTLVYPNSYMNS